MLFRSHTLTSHFYISRPIFAHRDSVDAWPEDIRSAMYDIMRDAIALQRDLSEQEAQESYAAIEAEGGDIIHLSDAEREAFKAAVAPQINDARETFGDAVFEIARL